MTMRAAEFERVFKSFDEDGDGKVSAAEIRTRLRSMGEELPMGAAEMAVEMMDSDGDGFLSMEDFIAMIENSGSEDEKMKDLRGAFEIYDSEGCGFIRPKDLKRVLSKVGEPRSLEECRVMIERFDLDGDGVLSFDEFRIMMQ